MQDRRSPVRPVVPRAKTNSLTGLVIVAAYWPAIVTVTGTGAALGGYWYYRRHRKD